MGSEPLAAIPPGPPPFVAAGNVDPAASAADAARCELAVVGVVGRRPRDVLEEIYLCLGAKQWCNANVMTNIRPMGTVHTYIYIYIIYMYNM